MPIQRYMRALHLFKIFSLGWCSSSTALLLTSSLALQMALAASCAAQMSKKRLNAVWSPSGEELEKGVDFVKCFVPFQKMFYVLVLHSSGTALLSVSAFALQMALSKSSCAASCSHQFSKKQIKIVIEVY